MKSGAYLRRYTKMTRAEPMRRKWIRRSPARRIDDRAFMRPYVAFVHTLACCCDIGVTRDGGRSWRDSLCWGDIEANHAGPKPGMGMKAPDSTVIPMCSGHHRDWTDHKGIFAGWTREDRRTWADARIAETRAAAPVELAELVA